MNIGQNQRRAPNLFREVATAPARQRATRATTAERRTDHATWRCRNAACGVWVQPSRAEVPGTCHACGTAEKAL